MRKSILCNPGTELVKYVAYNGSSLTLIGLFELDAETGALKVTDLTHVLAGGLTEAQSMFASMLE